MSMYGASPSSGILAPVHTGSEEPIGHISSQSAHLADDSLLT